MARVLLGWELGTHRGHATLLAEVARALTHVGLEVHVALQSFAGHAALFPDGVRLWQAPLWPSLLAGAPSALHADAPATMGDILWRMGLVEPGVLTGLLKGWDAILSAVNPDHIIANFAPALLLAGNGRVARLSIGTGFEQPPPGLDRFPSISDAPPRHNEAQTCDAVNAALARAGRPAIDHLPAIFASERTIVAGFEELDIYAAHRHDARAVPCIGGVTPPLADGKGDEVFVYASERQMGNSALWQGLAWSGQKLRVHIPDASADMRARLAQLGLHFEPAPLGWDVIATRSRLIVSHGGHGFVSAALLAGVPQVIVHFDLEKQGYARANTQLGEGGAAALRLIEPKAFAESLCAIVANDALAERAQSTARTLRARAMPSLVDLTTGIVIQQR